MYFSYAVSSDMPEYPGQGLTVRFLNKSAYWDKNQWDFLKFIALLIL